MALNAPSWASQCPTHFYLGRTRRDATRPGLPRLYRLQAHPLLSNNPSDKPSDRQRENGCVDSITSHRTNTAMGPLRLNDSGQSHTTLVFAGLESRPPRTNASLRAFGHTCESTTRNDGAFCNECSRAKRRLRNAVKLVLLDHDAPLFAAGQLNFEKVSRFHFVRHLGHLAQKTYITPTVALIQDHQNYRDLAREVGGIGTAPQTESQGVHERVQIPAGAGRAYDLLYT
ncbi:hypothetical protein IWX90DRAFT_495748 [Phyllosticta citrichinensis]|uniref:Uncharacterized protein n=1 Tax=Phyllosticta citrichinensis TaxID=1130410 RepID=A0ABR1XG92_9PEZI